MADVIPVATATERKRFSWAPQTAYHVEVDDEEMREMPSDPGGILYFKGVRPQTALRFNRESVAVDPPVATSH